MLGTTTPSSFICVLGIRTQVLVLVQQAFCWWNHLFNHTNLGSWSYYNPTARDWFWLGTGQEKVLIWKQASKHKQCWEAPLETVDRRQRPGEMWPGSKLSNKLSLSGTRVSARQSHLTTLAWQWSQVKGKSFWLKEVWLSCLESEDKKWAHTATICTGTLWHYERVIELPKAGIKEGKH